MDGVGQLSERGQRSRVWSSDKCARVAPHAQASMPGAAPAYLPPALLLSGAKVPVSGMGRGCTLRRGGTKLRPNFMGSAPARWDLPSPVGLGQSVSTGEDFAHTGLWFLPPPTPPIKVTVASMPWEGVTLPTSAPALPQSIWAHRLRKDASTQGHRCKNKSGNSFT